VSISISTALPINKIAIIAKTTQIYLPSPFYQKFGYKINQITELFSQVPRGG